ncbi:hypothetical protein VNO77_13402 [Canavalia gladiata]|uniref:Uncharacterized protein n=1 Tax=Canavalia gladiata TaxID=3824 RepID=A0AAN9LXY2_CANGL
MGLEEAEDEEWDTNQYYYLSEPNAKSGSKMRWVFNKGLKLGKQVLVAGFVASSAPLLLPPLLVTSAIGLAVSMPYAFFLASHACSQCLMSKLLPMPTSKHPPLLEEVCFRPDSDIMYTYEEEQALADETKRDIEMVDVQYMKNGCCPQEENNGSKKENSGFFYAEEEEKALPQKRNDVELGAKVDDGMEGHLRGESNGVQPMSGDHGVVTMIEGLDKTGNVVEELKTQFEVTMIEELQDQGIEDGDIEEEELQRETKGLLEKIRDEGRTDSTYRRGEYAEGICGGTNESDKKIGSVVEDMEVVQEDKHGCIIGGTEGDLGNEEDPKVCEEIFQSRNDERKDTISNEVESDEPARGLVEGKEVDATNDSEKPMAESSKTIPSETMETQVYNISVAEDSPEVNSGKTDIHLVVEEEPKPLPDGCTILQKGKLDNNTSEFENQESQLHEYNEMMESSNADARDIALDLFDEKRIELDRHDYTIHLHEESLNGDEHTDSTEVLVSSVEQESGPSECSSGKNIIYPSQEVALDEENIWKQIHVVQKIVGYEDTTQASCEEELKALYIFTGVEPPTFHNENSNDPAELKEKLHFLMSILGIKWDMA